MTSTDGTPRRIPATDGFELAATIFEPGNSGDDSSGDDDSSDDVVIINAATAVPRGFYSAFASYLAGEGYTVVTYDYRGIGESRPESLRGFSCSASDWGLLDAQGVLDWVSTELAPAHIFAIGHSAGGQQAGLLLGADRITAMATVSAQSGYWKLQGQGEVAKVFVNSYLFMPLLTRLFGYFPWSKLASAEDLPRGAALQWAAWCRDPKYILGDDSLPLERYASFSAPVLAYSIDDDGWGTAASVESMMSAYPNVEFEHLVAADVGLSVLGHFGYFRPKSQPLWERTLQWLRDQAATA